jgi:signal transduction histidine kinase
MEYTDAPICVVDDDVSVRDALSSLIRSAGLRAETFTSAQEFLESPRVDASCLILDVEMPGLSGLDLQEKLAGAQIQIPIIFLTGRGDISMTVRAIKAGAFNFLTKPFDDEDLLKAIRTAVDRFRAAQEQDRKSARDGLQERVLPLLAHELLQPLNAILLSLEAAREEFGEQPADHAACDLAKREALHMSRIVHNVMDVCRDTRGTLRLNLQNVDLASLIEETADTVRPGMIARGQRLTVVLPPGPQFINADSTRLKQVLTNLLTNASKFTEPGGLIRLSVTASPEGVIIQVRDNGKGISHDLLPRIFDAFEQGNDPATRARGLGLGLSLVKSLVDLHGGSITAYSEGADMGAQFTIRLPAGDAGTPPAKGEVSTFARQRPRIEVL